MNFLVPAAFGLSTLLAVITALYLLRLRRKEHDISSLYLWRQMVHDREASAPWQKLRFNWLLLLQLLFLAVLILATARPFTWYEGVSGQSVILILDSSASMSATDTAPTRLEAARRRAQQIVNDLPADARVTVIEAGDETRVRVTSSQDRRQAVDAIDAVRPGSGEAELGMALELASAIASRQADAEIVVLSDGRAPLPEHLALRGRLNYIPVGLSGENQAISLLNVEPASAGGWDVFVQVANYGSQTAQRRLAILADGSLVNSLDLEIPAGGRQSVNVPGLPADVKRVEARLEGGDILPADDAAYSAVRQAGKVRAALLSPGSLFLTTALRLIPGVELVEVDPAEKKALPEADLYVFDGVLPAQLPERGSLWFIDPPGKTGLFDLSGSAEGPAPRLVDARDVLVKDVSLAGLHLLDARWIELPEWGQPVVAGDLPDGGSIPLIFRGEPGGRRVVVQAFALTHSDLPLSVAFPILTANIISWLTPGIESGLPGAVRAGEVFSLPEGITAAEVTRPDGSRETVGAVEGRLAVSDTRQIGFYKVKWEGGGVEFAANLISPLESDLKPAGTLGNMQSTNAAGQGENGLARREWWRWLALPALILLMLEWLVYQRSGLMKLRDWSARLIPGGRGGSSQGKRT